MLSLWLVVLLFVVYGVSYIVFGFVEPPSWSSSFYRVPRYFGLLPDRLIAPIGRTMVGLLWLFVAGMIAFRVLLNQ